MLKDGYRNVILPFTISQPSRTELPLDKTRSIQDRQFSEMDGAGCRT